jgi:hypothetical protein
VVHHLDVLVALVGYRIDGRIVVQAGIAPWCRCALCHECVDLALAAFGCACKGAHTGNDENRQLHVTGQIFNYRYI